MRKPFHVSALEWISVEDHEGGAALALYSGALQGCKVLVLWSNAGNPKLSPAEVLMGQKHRRSPDADQFEGWYANYFRVGYNALEFVLDFGQFYPKSTTAQFHTRIISGPVYAKAFLETLQESIGQYERTFGVIPRRWKKTFYEKCATP